LSCVCFFCNAAVRETAANVLKHLIESGESD
jgi:hypothetical protein